MDFITNDVNDKISPDKITPDWQVFRISFVEMLFNVTSDGMPDIREINNNPDADRCE